MKINHASMQQANETAILDHIRLHGTVSRTDVARDLGLSAATVTRAVRHLLQLGALHEIGVGVPTLGRPPRLLTYNRRQGFVIAVDVGGTACRAALADLQGEMLYTTQRPTRRPGLEPLDALFEVVEAALAESRGLPAGVIALTVGVPGIVTEPGGEVSGSPNAGWEDVPVGRLLRERFDVPIMVENDVNLAALGEAWRGAAQGIADFAVVSIGTGIGAGIVVGGELRRGRHNAAGEVGHMIPSLEQLHRPMGDRGWLESVAAGPPMTRRAEDLLHQDGRPSPLRELENIR